MRSSKVIMNDDLRRMWKGVPIVSIDSITLLFA